MKGKIIKSNEEKQLETVMHIKLCDKSLDLIGKIDSILNHLKPIKKIKK